MHEFLRFVAGDFGWTPVGQGDFAVEGLGNFQNHEWIAGHYIFNVGLVQTNGLFLHDPNFYPNALRAQDADPLTPDFRVGVLCRAYNPNDPSPENRVRTRRRFSIMAARLKINV